MSGYYLPEGKEHTKNCRDAKYRMQPLLPLGLHTNTQGETHLEEPLPSRTERKSLEEGVFVACWITENFTEVLL